MEKFHFICQRWLAVEKDDGKVIASFSKDGFYSDLSLDRTSSAGGE